MTGGSFSTSYANISVGSLVEAKHYRVNVDD